MSTSNANTVLQTLTRDKKLSQEEWEKLLEARANQLRDFLQQYTHPSLLDVEYRTRWGENSGFPGFTLQNVREKDDRLAGHGTDLDIRGIFSSMSLQKKSKDTYLIFGLSMGRRWTACTITEVPTEKSVDIVATIDFREVKPRDLAELGVPYHRLWVLLSSAVTETAKKLREQMVELDKLEHSMCFEDKALDISLEKHR